MASMSLLKTRMVSLGGWLAQDPVRVRLAIAAVSLLAVALMIVMGSSAGVSIAGLAGGGSGGSG